MMKEKDVLSLEKKRSLLEGKLELDVERKHQLEVRINGDYEKLKKIEISIEKSTVK